MYIPNTYAHGFTTIESDTELEYVTDNVYSFKAAKSIRYDDESIRYESHHGVDWTMGNYVKLNLSIRSEKNINASDLSKCVF